MRTGGGEDCSMRYRNDGCSGAQGSWGRDAARANPVLEEIETRPISAGQWFPASRESSSLFTHHSWNDLSGLSESGHSHRSDTIDHSKGGLYLILPSASLNDRGPPMPTTEYPDGAKSSTLQLDL